MCNPKTLGEKKKAIEVKFRELSKEYRLGLWHLTFSNGVTQLGYCWPSKREIAISQKFLEVAPFEKMIDTLLHEIAHALDYLERGYTNHDANWKKWCRVVGADPTRTASLPPEYSPEQKYNVICGECGIIGQRARKTKAYKQNRKICRKCYKTKGQKSYLTLEENPNY